MYHLLRQILSTDFLSLDHIYHWLILSLRKEESWGAAEICLYKAYLGLPFGLWSGLNSSLYIHCTLLKISMIQIVQKWANYELMAKINWRIESKLTHFTCKENQMQQKSFDFMYSNPACREKTGCLVWPKHWCFCCREGKIKQQSYKSSFQKWTEHLDYYAITSKLLKNMNVVLLSPQNPLKGDNL